MKSPWPVVLSAVAALLLASSGVAAQNSAGVAANSTIAVSSAKTGAVPSLVNYSGVLKDAAGRTVSSLTGVTFLIYKDQQGGAPLWLETQNVTPDRLGHYTVQLGSGTSAGLPSQLFLTGDARWLAVQIAGEAEQPRVLLVAVPYAMKAADAETIGGLPPSAFVLAAPAANNTGPSAATTSSATPAPAPPPVTSNVTTTGGTVNAVPLFTTATNVQNSILTQTAATAVNVGGKLNLPATGTATATAGKDSRPEDFVASAFNSGTAAAVAQTFQLQAEPAGNDTTAPSGTLNLLYGSGNTAPAETGLKISSKGLFMFATGQTFPGTGTGSVKSVGLTAPASDFTVSGSPVTGTGTLNFVWKVAPTSADSVNAIVKRDGSGNFSAATISASALNAASTSLSSFLSINSTGVTPLYAASNAVSATVIEGDASASTGDAWGVEGVTASSSSAAYGVIGLASSTTGNPDGVYGQASSPFGVGVFGENGNALSSVGALFAGSYGVGTWGDGGTDAEIGVLGTTGDNFAGYFVNDGVAYSLYAQNNDASGNLFLAYNTNNGNSCNIDSGGNLTCTGTITPVVATDSGKRMVAMSAIEAPQNWFEDAGEAELVNGAAVVPLDSTYVQTVNTGTKYQVFLTPYGDCKGLYVTSRTANSFDVHELGGGTASLSFGYRIMALRKKYENVRFADRTQDLQKIAQGQERMKARRAQPRRAAEVRKSPLAILEVTKPILEPKKRWARLSTRSVGQ